MNIIKDERDRYEVSPTEYFQRASRALRPLRKALMEFARVIKRVNWKELNESLHKVK